MTIICFPRRKQLAQIDLCREAEETPWELAGERTYNVVCQRAILLRPDELIEAR